MEITHETAEITARLHQLVLLQGGRYRTRVDEAVWNRQPALMEVPVDGSEQRTLPSGSLLVLPWDAADPAWLEQWLAGWARRFGALPRHIVLITSVGHVSERWLRAVSERHDTQIAAVEVSTGDLVGPRSLVEPLSVLLDDEAAATLDTVNPLAHIDGVEADPRDPAVFAERLRRAAPRAGWSRGIFGANVLIFMLMQLADGWPLFARFSYDTVISFGANTRGLTLGAGELWRLVSATFLHADLMHLGMNMWALHSLGPAVERLVGARAFVAIYAASALGGSIASLGFTLRDNPNWPTVGASGAIFGLMGALLGFALARRGTVPPDLYRSLLRSSLFFIALNTVIGFSLPFIDNAAHLGGLAAGVVGGALLSRDLPPAPQPPWWRVAGAIVMLGASLIVALRLV